jgi:hypothetical protein
MNCQKFEEIYWLRHYGEAVAGEEEAWQLHADTCPHCRARLEAWDKLRALLAAREPCTPRPEALEHARRRLTARLRARRSTSRLQNFGEWVRRILSPQGIFRRELGVAVAALALGLILGRTLLQPEFRIQTGVIPEEPASFADNEKEFIAENLLRDGARISNLKVRRAPNEDDAVVVNFTAAREYQITGRPDDPVVLDLLGWAVKNEDNSGVRLQSVEELARASSLSPLARQTLAYALVNDENPGVRLRALDALAGTTPDELAEQAYLNALLKDPNPAVRIRAIDALLQSRPLEKAEAFILRAAELDSNEYVRLQARRALRQTNADYQILQRNSGFGNSTSRGNYAKTTKGESK